MSHLVELQLARFYIIETPEPATVTQQPCSCPLSNFAHNPMFRTSSRARSSFNYKFMQDKMSLSLYYKAGRCHHCPKCLCQDWNRHAVSQHTSKLRPWDMCLARQITRAKALQRRDFIHTDISMSLPVVRSKSIVNANKPYLDKDKSNANIFQPLVNVNQR